MKLTQRDAIVKALLARGEVKVEDKSLSRVWKFTRTYWATRGTNGELQHAKETGTFWFVSKYTGAMRVGSSSTKSNVARKEAKDALVAEWRALP